MKKFSFKGIFLILITIAVMWYILKDNFDGIVGVLLTSNVWWILVAIIIYIIFLSLESLMTKFLINQYDKDYSLFKAIKLTIMAKFFNGVTPFSSGGQPLQVYELKEEGLRTSSGIAVVTEHFIINQTCIVLLSLLASGVNYIFKFIIIDTTLKHLFILGLILNVGLLIIVYILSAYKNVYKKIIFPIIKFLSKLKIIKNSKKIEENVKEACQNYYVCYAKMIKNKKLVLKTILIQTLALLVTFSIPVFVFFSLGYLEHMNLVACLIISVYVFIVGSYIPLPGGSGGIEYAFITCFSLYVVDSYVVSALILWRFITYYLPMIIGAMVFNIRKSKHKHAL